MINFDMAFCIGVSVVFALALFVLQRQHHKIRRLLEQRIEEYWKLVEQYSQCKELLEKQNKELKKSIPAFEFWQRMLEEAGYDLNESKETPEQREKRTATLAWGVAQISTEIQKNSVSRRRALALCKACASDSLKALRQAICNSESLPPLTHLTKTGLLTLALTPFPPLS